MFFRKGTLIRIAFSSLYLVKVKSSLYEAKGEELYYARVEIRLVGHLMDALPGAFRPPGLWVVTSILGRRGLSNVL